VINVQRPNIWNIGGGSLPEFLMQPTMVLSLLQARLGPKTTARFAAVILFMSHLKIHSYLFSIALFLRFHIGSAKTNRHCWITNLQVFLPLKKTTCRQPKRWTRPRTWGPRSSDRAASWSPSPNRNVRL